MHFLRISQRELKNNFEVIFYTEPKPLKDHLDFLSDLDEKIIALDPDYFDWKFAKEDIYLCENVKAICLQTTSFNWIDTEHAKEKNIPILNLKGFSSEAVSEFAFMLALGVARKLPLIIQSNYKQDFLAHQGMELRCKKAGIVGLGRIGNGIAEKTKAFGMDTFYWSKNSRNENFKYLELEDLFLSCDIIFISLAYNEDTKNILSEKLIKSINKTSILISFNVTKKLINEESVIKMVQDGDLYGYGTEEDNTGPDKIKGNILILPAVAWDTTESLLKSGEMWTDSILKAKEGIFLNRVN